MYASTDDIIKLGLALLLGAILGIEREYRSKAAGFRTLTLISLGACLFTIISQHLGAPGNPDRIASNIVQGIGFLGAGVIFKDNLSVTGLTTATAIWVASAIGMSAGAGSFMLASFTTLAALIVLGGFELIQQYIDRWHQHRVYKLTYQAGTIDSDALEKDFQQYRIRFFKRKESRDKAEITCWYELYGKVTSFEVLDRCLLEDSRILSFDN
jgi:putative Mg2+ transporter-C (MgtC) family protein